MQDILSPLDERYKQYTWPLQKLFGEKSLMRFRLQVEISWLIHLLGVLKIPFNQAKIENILTRFGDQDYQRIKVLEQSLHHDVKAVEIFLQETLAQQSDTVDLQSWVHFGATSDDINNLSYSMMITQGLDQVIKPQISELINMIKVMANQYADTAILSHTHGQPATPTTFGKEMAVYIYRLDAVYQQMYQLTLQGKFSGAVGNYNAMMVAMPDQPWQTICRDFIQSLKLEPCLITTQINPHDDIVRVLQTLAHMNGICIDLARDIWLYLSKGYLTLTPKGIGSSTMPHKVNPIAFENAEGNLGFANAMANHLSTQLPCSRLQRDLTDSTLLRNIGVIFGHSSTAYQHLIEALPRCQIATDVVADDLNQHWEVLAEAVQTLLRSRGESNAYHSLKELTQGIGSMDKASYLTLLKTLPLSGEDLKRLESLTPQKYVGLTRELLDLVLR